MKNYVISESALKVLPEDLQQQVRDLHREPDPAPQLKNTQALLDNKDLELDLSQFPDFQSAVKFLHNNGIPAVSQRGREILERMYNHLSQPKP